MQQFRSQKPSQIEPHVLGAVILGAWSAVSILLSVFLSFDFIRRIFPYEILKFVSAVFLGNADSRNFLFTSIVLGLRPLHLLAAVIVVAGGATFMTKSKATALVAGGAGLLHLLIIWFSDFYTWGDWDGSTFYNFLRSLILLAGIGLAMFEYAKDPDSLKNLQTDLNEAIALVTKKMPASSNQGGAQSTNVPPQDFSGNQGNFTQNQQGGNPNMSNFQNPGGQWNMYGPDFHTPMFYVQSYATGNQLVSAAQLQQMARAGTIQPSTMVQHRDSSFPVPVSSIPGVFSSKSYMTALLLSIFLGGLGVDRFYLGYTGLGIVKLLTFGGCGIWSLIDLVLIAMRNLNDSDGNPLS